ncbi:hypothetical protein TorRG33x02_351330 [Trema orientale]|uniref:Uncharacterized protein n=1 Tax=Trema orientale TaxID=63057 RepID=A0A2P5AFY7_TREOI|nr:hypothetical protein TorRG33x02_351330 [Trema orientale]
MRLNFVSSAPISFFIEPFKRRVKEADVAFYNCSKKPGVQALQSIWSDMLGKHVCADIVLGPTCLLLQLFYSLCLRMNDRHSSDHVGFPLAQLVRKQLLLSIMTLISNNWSKTKGSFKAQAPIMTEEQIIDWFNRYFNGWQIID